MARSADPVSYATIVSWVYVAGIPLGVLAADDQAVREIEDALQVAERSSDDIALSNARMTLGCCAWCTAFRLRSMTADSKLLAEVSEVFRRPGYNLGDLPIIEVYLAAGNARHGDLDGAIRLMRAATDRLVGDGQLLGWGIPSDGCPGADTARSRGRR